MSNLILGGLITLAGSAVVQVGIVPWVATKRRHRERWEERIISLSALLEVELPAAFQALRKSALLVTMTRTKLSKVTAGGNERVALSRLEDQYHAEAVAAGERVTELRAQMIRLFDQARLYRRTADYWARLFAQIAALDLALKEADYRTFREDASLDSISDRSHLVNARTRSAVLVLKQVSDTMKPPRSRSWAQVSRRARKLTKRMPQRTI